MENNNTYRVAPGLSMSYSPIGQNGPEKYITITFQSDDGKFAKADYPVRGFYDVTGFSDKEIGELQMHLNRMGHMMFSCALEEELELSLD